jgi:CRISPR-associated endonuclease Csn1
MECKFHKNFGELMTLILGIDGGIATIGWGVIEATDQETKGKILAAGTRTFESPEEPSQAGPKLKNADRRMYRGQRRVVRRRAQRMARIRRLFCDQGLIASIDRDVLNGNGLDPWNLRAEALDRCLTPREWATALAHIAIHRGFRSNSKRDRSANAADETSKMLSAIQKTQERSQKWRTIGEMFAHDPEFVTKRRNRVADFTRSILRDDQEAEVRKLFEEQRRFGNATASPDLCKIFCDLAFSQRPLQSSEDRVGDCIFEPQEKRTAKFAPSFERFRYLSRLVHMRLQTGRHERPLTEEEIGLCIEGFGQPATITFKAIRRRLDLDANTRFAGVGKDDEKHDVATRTGAAATGTSAFIKTLGPAIGDVELRMLLSQSSALDRAAEIITFNEDTQSIASGLASTSLSLVARQAILGGVEKGSFDAFKGAAHISAKAARAIIPALMQGLVYSDACEAAGYDHSARAATNIEDISSPVARKALSEMLKQVKVLQHEYGPFDRIHVEMARDVGKSIEERGKIERGIDKRTNEKSKLRDELKEILKLEIIKGDDLLRYELWREQNGRCLYTDEAIPLDAVLATDNRLQIDHILPWSRFGDDSYINKTLCFTQANAEKQGNTPYEWFMRSKPQKWDAFAAAVEACKTLKGRKKRNYLLRNAQEVEQQFRERNLNDTRYATRVLLGELKRLYFPETPHHVAARPGELTSKLRQAWGIERLKKSATGERLPDDRHHALDAIVVAATSESLLQLTTKVSQQAERTGAKFELRCLPEPWPGFREEVKAVHSGIFVSRAEVRRARGKAHDATIKQLRIVEGEQRVFERKSIDKLAEKDLALIPVPEPHGRVSDPAKLRDELVESLRVWIATGKPKDNDKLPRSPKGDIIRKVRVMTNAKPAVLVRGGTADRGGIVRVDVFTKPNKRGAAEFFLVPIYVHEVATLDEPPNRAVQAYATEAD